MFPVFTVAENCVKTILRCYPSLRNLWLDRQVWHSKSNKTVPSLQQNMNMSQSEMAPVIWKATKWLTSSLKMPPLNVLPRPWSTVLENWSLLTVTIYSLNLYHISSILSNNSNNMYQNHFQRFLTITASLRTIPAKILTLFHGHRNSQFCS